MLAVCVRFSWDVFMQFMVQENCSAELSVECLSLPHCYGRSCLINLRFYVQLNTIGHFGDILPSQSLGIVLKKLNLTWEKQTTQEQNGINYDRQKMYKKKT